jgi:hypothetical protein
MPPAATFRTAVLAALAILTMATSPVLKAQCEQLDVTGDGQISSADVLAFLWVYGTADSIADINANGVVDVEDCFTLYRWSGDSCMTPMEDSVQGAFLGLHVELYHYHDQTIYGISDTIPVGAVTYRLYAQTAQPTPVQFVCSAFGIPGQPAHISSPSGLFFSTSDFVGLLPDEFYPQFTNADAAVEYSSWFAMGAGPVQFQASSWPSTILLGASETDLAQGDLLWDQGAGGGWAAFNSSPSGLNANFTGNTNQLIGQFTTMDATPLTGMLNVVVRVDTNADGQWDAIEAVYGATFSSENAFEEVWTISDLLTLLGQFGCNGCPSSDWNGDGTVNVFDLLLFLQAWG